MAFRENPFKTHLLLWLASSGCVLLCSLLLCLVCPAVPLNSSFVLSTLLLAAGASGLASFLLPYTQKKILFLPQAAIRRLFADAPAPLRASGLTQAIIELQGQQQVAERHLSDLEDHYRTIFEKITEGVFCCDQECRPLEANPAMARILGYASEQEFVSQSPNLAAALFQNSAGWLEARRRLEAGEELRGVKTEFQRRDGCTVWGEFRILPLKENQTTPCAFTIIFQDTTLGNLAGQHARLQEQLHRERLEQIVEQRTRELHGRNKELIKQIEERGRAERALQAAKEDAEAANNAKSVFLASISHEIRTPINAMLGMSQVLSESALSGEQTQYVRILQSAGEGLLTLINNILDISKIEAGQLQLENTHFRLADVVDKVFAVLQPQIRAKQLQLHGRTDPGLPEIFFGDPLRLQQILLNILNNAIKFTEKGDVRLRIQAHGQDAARAGDPTQLLFTITDTGIGIPPHQHGSIFDSFTQADTSITRKYGGSGLGLAISKVLVGLMGGSIWFSSVPGQGSEFCFTVSLLPQLQENPPQQLRLWEHPDPALFQDLPPLRILLVEDSEFNAVVVESYLKETPCRLDKAADGKIGLRMFQEGGYDLVLMDIQMPEMDGYTATRQIRLWENAQKLQETPIFAMTAYALEGDRQKSLAAGCNLHLIKPIKKELLLGAIFAWFSSPDFSAYATSAAPGPPTAPGWMPPPEPAQPPPAPPDTGPPDMLIDVPVDPELFEMAPRFVDTVQTHLRTLEKCAAAQDFNSARTIGHQMKGEGKLFGLGLVSELGLAIQQAAEAKDSAAITAKARELAAYLQRVRLIPATPE